MVATGYTGGDPTKLSLSGGTLTGPLTGTSATFTGVTANSTLTWQGFALPTHGFRQRRPWVRRVFWQETFQSGHGWTVQNAASSADDTTVSTLGQAQSLRVTTDGTGASCQVRKTGISPSLSFTGKILRIWLRVQDVTHLGSVQVSLGQNTFSPVYNWTPHTHSVSSTNLVQSSEWVPLDCPWSAVTSFTGFTYTNAVPSTKTGMTALQVRVTDDGTAPITWWIQAIEVIDDSQTSFPNGVISITFDDSWQNQFTKAAPIMAKYDTRGTFYTIADLIGNNASYMTKAQLRALQDHGGHEIAGHTYSNALHGLSNGLADATAAQVREDFRKLKTWLISNGFEGDNFAYPKGHFDATTDGVLVSDIASEFWSTSRTITEGNRGTNFPAAMPQRVQAYTGITDMVGSSQTVDNIIASGGLLDRIQNNGGWGILCLHSITDTTATQATELSKAKLDLLCSTIASRGIPTRTIQETVRYYT